MTATLSRRTIQVVPDPLPALAEVLLGLADREVGCSEWVDEPRSGEPGWRSRSKLRLHLGRVLSLLRGGVPGLAIPFGDERGLTRRVVFDVDAHKEGEVAEPALERLVEVLERRARGAYFLARSRGGRGYHAWILLSRPVPLRAALALGERIRAAAGIDCEVFPKHTDPALYGAAIALPGSAVFRRRTGGSVLLDERLEPLPLELWADRILSLEPLDATDLEEDLASEGETAEASLAAQAPRGECTAREPTPAPDGGCWTLERLESFFRDRGAGIVSREAYASARWTHRLKLRRCVGQDAHGASDQDHPGQAAVLFDERTGRVGYRCLHAACRLGFAGAVARLDPGAARRIRTEVAKRAARATDGDVRGALRAREAARLKRFPTYSAREREALRSYGEDLGGLELRTGKRFARCAECGQFAKELGCEKDGPQAVALIPCGDRLLCPYCAERDAAELRAFIAARWKAPESEREYFGGDVAAVRIHSSAGDVRELQAIRRREVNRFRKVAKAKPRWVLGDACVLLLWPASIGELARRLYPDAEVLPSEAAGELVARTWLSPHLRLRDLAKSGDLGALARDPWLTTPNVVRTGAARHARSRLPWWGTLHARLEAKREAEERGEDPCTCSQCGGLLSTTVTWIPTGATLAAAKGCIPDWRVARLVARTRIAKPFLAPSG